jgi:hypothetical protein
VEVHKKITQTPSVVKRARIAQTKKDNTPNKRPIKKEMMPLQKIVNVSQPALDRQLVDIPQFSTQACDRKGNASTSKNPDAIVLENYETPTGIQEIPINYISFGEVYDRSTTIINPYFSTIIAENFLTHPDPKTMTECKGRSD